MNAQEKRATSIAFMFVSLGVMVFTMLLALFAQFDWTYFVCAGVYLGKVMLERRYGIVSPLSLALLFVYAALAAAGAAGMDYTGYAGAIIFSWMFVVVGVLLAIGKPFTTFYSQGAGLPALHRTISVIWLLAYGAAIAATWLFIPNPLFIVLPALFCLVAGAVTLYVSFVWCGRRHERQKRYASGDLSFMQIENNSDDFNAYCDFFVRNVCADSQHALPEGSEPRLIPRHRELERALGDDAVVFVCKHEGQIIGSIRCILGRPGKPIPAENYMRVSFDAMREQGPIMFVGRLAIDEAYRHRPDILNGLFAGFINLALERDMAYVVSEGFKLSLPIYLKLGFETLFGRKDERFETKNGLGLTVYPVVLDFEPFVMAKPDEKDDRFGMINIVNPYLAERYYKRTVVRRFFRKMAGKRRPNDIKDLRAVMAPSLAA